MTGVVRRFWLFHGRTFYPEGGANDFAGSYDTIDDAVAVAAGRTLLTHLGAYMYCWWHVLDTQTMTIVREDDH